MDVVDIAIYNELLKISSEILVAGQNHDVEAIDALIDEMNEQAKAIYPDIVSPEQLSPEKIAILHRLAELNDRTLELAITRRQDIAEQIKQIKNSEKVQSAYGG